MPKHRSRDYNCIPVTLFIENDVDLGFAKFQTESK